MPSPWDEAYSTASRRASRAARSRARGVSRPPVVACPGEEPRQPPQRRRCRTGVDLLRAAAVGGQHVGQHRHVAFASQDLRALADQRGAGVHALQFGLFGLQRRLELARLGAGDLDLLVEGQVLRDLGDALDQGAAMAAAVEVGPEDGAFVAAAAVDGAGGPEGIVARVGGHLVRACRPVPGPRTRRSLRPDRPWSGAPRAAGPPAAPAPSPGAGLRAAPPAWWPRPPGGQADGRRTRSRRRPRRRAMITASARISPPLRRERTRNVAFVGTTVLCVTLLVGIPKVPM